MSARPARLGVALGLLGVTGSAALFAAPGAAPSCNTATTPFCNSTVPLPTGWKGRRFTLAQNYPAKAPADSKPWLAVDPKANPELYIRTVLSYFYEGNIRPNTGASFDPAMNSVRGWYNAPWQDQGTNGREPIHGLTRERVSLPGEVDAAQTSFWNNYAVGFYNAPGGTMFGKVWTNHGKPNLAMAIAPEGTVAAKLLFTTAGADQVPWIKGSPEWDAYVWADYDFSKNHLNPPPGTARVVRKVRLLQLDIAVKDKRAGVVGWVFGTFVYNGGAAGRGASGWTNVEPVGLMWGNDPGYSGTGPLKESWLNPAVILPHAGYQRRLNGPVDNPTSSCLSCHMVAEGPESGVVLGGNLIAKTKGDPRWFQNLPSGQPFTPGKQSLDYSMQMAFGLSSFFDARSAASGATPALRRAARQKLLNAAAPPRGGTE
jgi:hypothetical protein